MVIGCLALVAVFFVALVLNALRVALAIQLQPARIFWMLDFTATAYLVWALPVLAMSTAAAIVLVAMV